MQQPAAKAIDLLLMQPPAAALGNPTLWLFAADLAVFVAATALYASGSIAGPLAGVVAVVCLYCFYTVSHEAAHGNIVRSRRVNTWVGRVSAALEGLSFPLFRILHLQHHAFTNDPRRDPDYVIGRRPTWLLPLWTAVRLTHDNQFMISRRLWAGRRSQLWEHLITIALQGGVIAAAVLTGRFEMLLWTWLGPVVVAGALLELTVAWAVHYPHRSQHPLENTRNYPGRLWQVLMLGQNFHLVHHLWPRIAWFRYARALEASERAVAEHRLAAAAPG